METLEMAIVTKKTDREKVFRKLYEMGFPVVAHFVSKMNGSFQDAKDIFQDALVIYYEKTTNRLVDIQTSPEAYILGIAKHLWIRKFKNDQKKIFLSSTESAIFIPEDNTPAVNDNRLLQFLEKTGRKCLDLLRSFYYENASAKDIATTLGYRNEHSATVQKYKCLEKIRNTINEKSIRYEDFLE